MRYSQTSALTSASFDESTMMGLVSSVVGCASASNDNKITGRQITANTTAKQHDLDMLTTLQRTCILLIVFTTAAAGIGNCSRLIQRNDKCNYME